ncbi:hypothetical protein GCM10007190_14530 [Macrococcus hajekii]|uniref:SpaA isopeptide-forming pilin-related protein n=1 Tax=Macrococcus hajekii TaxID=198482 RepID=UPI00140D7282|nr:SpaA isopeptide-forming pilin-related protein [Macrococcus hajekii]GGB07638.1 hypothetical protein GCM10007190_14530 [Macrococcus hajekii]
MNIRKLFYLLFVFLYLNTFIINPLSSASQLTQSSSNPNLLEVTGPSDEASQMNWQIKINPENQLFDDQKVTLHIEGTHKFVTNEIVTAFKSKGIDVVTIQDGISYQLLIPKELPATVLTVSTYVDSNTQSNYKMFLSGTMQGSLISAQDVVYPTTSVQGTLSFENLPPNQEQPSVTVNLTDELTGQVISSQIIPPVTTAYTFDNVRLFNDSGQKINYSVQIVPIANFTASIQSYDILLTFKSTEVQGIISNPNHQTVNLKIIDSSSNEIIAMKQISDDGHYEVTDLPLEDNQGNKIIYKIEADEVPGYDIKINGFDINVNPIEKLSSETPTSEQASTEGITTETPTSEQASTEGITTETPTSEQASTESVTIENPTFEQVSTEGITTETPTSEQASTESVTIENPTSEQVSTEGITTETPTSEQASTEGVTTETPTVTAPSVQTSMPFTFTPTFSSLQFRALAATPTSTYGSSKSTAVVNIATGSGTMTLLGQMNSTQTAINWTLTLSYGTLASKTVWFNDITTSTGISMPSSVDYTVTNGGTTTRSGQLPVTTSGGTSSIFLDYVKNNDLVTVVITTPITTPDLNSYTLTVGKLTYDELGIKYDRNGISNTVTKKTAGPTVNMVTSADTVVTGTAEPGATVTVRNSSGVVLGNAVADSSGNYSVKIAAQPKDTVLSVTAQSPNKLISDSVPIKVVGLFNFTVKKINESGTGLSGSTFNLKSSNGAIITKTSDANGLVQFTSLAPGSYTLNETAAPAGYLKDTLTHTILIDNTGVIKVDNTTVSSAYNFVNKAASSIIVNTYDANTNVPLSGVTYQLYDSTNKLIGIQTSDSAGNITFSDLPLGTYTLKQTNTRSGYRFDSASKTITLSSSTPVTVKSPQYTNVLPNTGGEGTLSFTMIGIILVIVAFILKKSKPYAN